MNRNSRWEEWVDRAGDNDLKGFSRVMVLASALTALVFATGAALVALSYWNALVTVLVVALAVFGWLRWTFRDNPKENP